MGNEANREKAFAVLPPSAFRADLSPIELSALSAISFLYHANIDATLAELREWSGLEGELLHIGLQGLYDKALITGANNSKVPYCLAYGVHKEIEEISLGLIDQSHATQMRISNDIHPPPRVDVPKCERSEAYIYIMASHPGIYKIGISNDPTARCTKLQIAHFVTLRVVAACGPLTRDEAYAGEKKLHAAFKKYRGEGEWFKLTEKNLRHAIGLMNTFAEVQSTIQNYG